MSGRELTLGEADQLIFDTEVRTCIWKFAVLTGGWGLEVI